MIYWANMKYITQHMYVCGQRICIQCGNICIEKFDRRQCWINFNHILFIHKLKKRAKEIRNKTN